MRRLGWLNLPLWLTYVFLYVPILVLVVMSFNASKTPFTWTGFSTRWYGELFDDALIRKIKEHNAVTPITQRLLVYLRDA